MNHSVLPLFVLAFSAVGCEAASIDAVRDTKLADAHGDAEHAIAYARCADGSQFGAGCGLIMRMASSPEFREQFRTKVCAPKTDDECDVAFQRLIDAEMSRRYFAANLSEVRRRCDLNPGRCDDGIAYEWVVLGSHNAHVQEKFVENEVAIETEREAAHRARHAAALELAFEAAAIASAATVCHSRPSVFGGYSSVCSH